MARQNWTMGVGLVVLLGLFIVTVKVHLPSRAALWTLLLIEALAAGAVAEGLTGQMKISGTLFGWGLRAGGAIGFGLAVLWAGLHFSADVATMAVRGATNPSGPDSGLVAGGGATNSATPDAGPAGGGAHNTEVDDTVGDVQVENDDLIARDIPAGGAGNTRIKKTRGDVTIKNGKTVLNQRR